MEELVQQVAAAAGISADKARTALSMMFAFLKKEGPTDEVDALLAELPGGREAAASVALNPSPGGFLAGLMGAISGGGGLMGLAGQLTGIGLSMGEIQSVGKELFEVARKKAGAERVGRIVAAIPGLSQFV